MIRDFIKDVIYKQVSEKDAEEIEEYRYNLDLDKEDIFDYCTITNYYFCLYNDLDVKDNLLDYCEDDYREIEYDNDFRENGEIYEELLTCSNFLSRLTHWDKNILIFEKDKQVIKQVQKNVRRLMNEIEDKEEHDYFDLHSDDGDDMVKGIDY